MIFRRSSFLPLLLAVALVTGTACSETASQPDPELGAAPAAQQTDAPAPASEATPDDTVPGEAAPSEPAPRHTAEPEAARARDEVALDAASAPRVPRSRGELLERLVASEKAIRDESVRGGDLAAAAHHQQVVYRELARRPGWRRWVLRRVPKPLRPAARANLRANELLLQLGKPGDKLPSWRIVKPAPADELLAHYRRAERRFGVPWQYLAAINLVETRMGRIRGVSVAGAQGPMQFMPQTWDHWGRGDVHDDGDAIDAAARYLVDHGAPGDMSRALWHYNRSDYYVRSVAAYAETMIDDPRAFRGYYHWQVYFRTKTDDNWLPERWSG